MRLLLDASVAAKWFNIEELSEEAVRVKDANVSGDVELIALTHEDTSDAIISLLRLDMQLLPPAVERASRAIKIARQRRITFYLGSHHDCIHPHCYEYSLGLCLEDLR